MMNFSACSAVQVSITLSLPFTTTKRRKSYQMTFNFRGIAITKVYDFKTSNITETIEIKVHT